MSAYFPIRNLVRLARLFGLAVILIALLATPVECLCGDPYPSAHALLEFILLPRTIIMRDDGTAGMAMTMTMARQTHSQREAPAAPVTINTGTDLPVTDSSTSPTIQDDGGHLERAGSYSALAGLLLVFLVANFYRPSRDSAAIWREHRPRPATPPPRFLFSVA